MRLDVLKRGISRFNKATSVSMKVFAAFSLCIFGSLLFEVASESYDTYKDNHLSAAENLRTAQSLCPKSGTATFACYGSGADSAISHLQNISSDAPEYEEGSKMLLAIREWKRALQIAAEKASPQKKAEHDRLTNQTEEESREQMRVNIAGEAHDSFTCGTSTANTPIISFDYGRYWWADDGRCASAQEEEREAKERVQQQQRANEQRNRDADAELYSYWPTTLRVDTDMNSFWLNNEERTCQTYPNGQGQVAVVACETSGSHRDHNIPVKFWGGVDRSTISNWKCRRESDAFVCRAVD
ncbi:MAG TPA: hypothetical protein VK763_15280 [Terriglobales bacterium]|jgi:hypothetical protein|nr:hypothetical protein [Terriglobales bacterium]